MASNVKRQTAASETILEQIDCGEETLMVIKNTATANPISYSGNVPFHQADLHRVTTADETDPGAEPTLVGEFDRVRIRITKRREAMTYTWRRVDADEIFFVHSGKAKIVTEVGQIDAPMDRLIFITRGVSYRVIPESDDFMALIVDSQAPVQTTEGCGMIDLSYVYSTFPLDIPDANGQIEWEERLVAADWTATVVRSYDPIGSKQVVGDKKPVYAVDIENIPANEPTAPMPGYPFEIFENAEFNMQISKRSDPLPFYHRNVRRNEIFFCHCGCGDQDSDLGFLSNPPGMFWTMPKGVEHSPMNREDPIVNVILETEGTVKINPEILKK